MNSSKNSMLAFKSEASSDLPAVMGSLSGAGWER